MNSTQECETGEALCFSHDFLQQTDIGLKVITKNFSYEFVE